jgi:uncharacterized protein
MMAAGQGPANRWPIDVGPINQRPITDDKSWARPKRLLQFREFCFSPFVRSEVRLGIRLFLHPPLTDFPKEGNRMNNNVGRAVAVSTVGYMCLAITAWMISMTYASWFSRQYGMALLYPVAIVLGVMGILSFVENRSLDAIVFFGGTALLGSTYAYNATTDVTRVSDPGSYLGWFAIVWAVFFAYVWLGSFKSGVTRMLFLLGLWLSLTSLAIGGWSGTHGWVVLAGYIGLVTAILAAVTSASEIIRFGTAGNPNMPKVVAPRAIAAD